MGRRFAALAALSVASAACELVFPMGGYKGSMETDASSESSVDATGDQPSGDASAGDAPMGDGSDGGPGDGPATDRSANDAPSIVDAGDGATLTWCQRQTFDAAAWCFDYDEPDSAIFPLNGQGSKTAENGAMMSILAGTDPSSLPNMLVASVPALSDGTMSASALEEFIPSNGSPSTAELAFDYQTDEDSVQFLSAMYWFRGGPQVTYTIKSGKGSLTLGETLQPPDGGMNGQDHTASAAVNDHGWHRFDLTVRSDGTATLLLDENDVVDAPADFGSVWQLDFWWGVSYTGGPSQAATYNFDNVVLQVW